MSTTREVLVLLAACYCCDLGEENAAAGPYFQHFFKISINAIKCSTGKSLHLYFSGPVRVCLLLFNYSPWSSTIWFCWYFPNQLSKFYLTVYMKLSTWGRENSLVTGTICGRNKWFCLVPCSLKIMVFLVVKNRFFLFLMKWIISVFLSTIAKFQDVISSCVSLILHCHIYN